MQREHESEETDSVDNKRKKSKSDNTTDFILTCIQTSIGLGNFWRFPYIAYRNYGGAFVVAYIVVILIIGSPMYYLDVNLGRFSGRGSIELYYHLAPGWLGLGISQALCCIATYSYYAYILSIVLWYFSHSFTAELPWAKCDPKWGDSCVSRQTPGNKSSQAITSSDYYLHKTILRSTNDLSDGIGMPNVKLSIFLFVVWMSAFIYLVSNIRIKGKFAYFSVLFPYLMLIILFIRSSVTEGAIDGLIYFFIPDWEHFIRPEVWLAATGQVFFSLGIGYGNIATYATYNDYDYSTILIVYIILVNDTFTNLLCGMAIFSNIGNLAHRLNVNFRDVMDGYGMTFIFISYSEAISNFEQVPCLYSVIFFFILFAIGMVGICSLQQVVTTNMLELLPVFKGWHVAAITSIFGFLSGIIYTTPGGQAIVEVIDLYGNVYLLMANAMVMVIAVFYVYGLQKWCWDLEFINKRATSHFWKFMSSIVTFVVMAVIYVYGCFQDNWLEYENKPIPTAFMVSGYILLILGSSPIPFTIIYFWVRYHNEGMTCGEAFNNVFSSTNWLPRNNKRAQAVILFRETKLENYPLKDENTGMQFFSALVNNY